MPHAEVFVAPGKSKEVKFAPATRNACSRPLTSRYTPAIWPCALISSAWVTVDPATGTSKLRHSLPLGQTKPCLIGELTPESHTPPKSPRALIPDTAMSPAPRQSPSVHPPL